MGCSEYSAQPIQLQQAAINGMVRSDTAAQVKPSELKHLNWKIRLTFWHIDRTRDPVLYRWRVLRLNFWFARSDCSAIYGQLFLRSGAAIIPFRLLLHLLGYSPLMVIRRDHPSFTPTPARAIALFLAVDAVSGKRQRLQALQRNQFVAPGASFVLARVEPR